MGLRDVDEPWEALASRPQWVHKQHKDCVLSSQGHGTYLAQAGGTARNYIMLTWMGQMRLLLIQLLWSDAMQEYHCGRVKPRIPHASRTQRHKPSIRPGRSQVCGWVWLHPPSLQPLYNPVPIPCQEWKNTRNALHPTFLLLLWRRRKWPQAGHATGGAA